MDELSGIVMTSPAKLLLLALFVAAFVAYFGDRIIMVSKKVEEARTQQQPQTTNELVYAKANRMDGGGDIRVPMSRDGHYRVMLDVNGTPVRFIVDTGASHISLSYSDAKDVGLDPEGLRYDRIYKTANGVTRKAIVKLDRVSIDAVEMSNVLASVSQRGQLEVSLLGMNFLNKLSGFRVEERVLVLKP